MRLSDLCCQFDLAVAPEILARCGDLMLFGVTEDSRDVRFGFIFCALPGLTVDGARFAPKAAARGAQMVLVGADVPDEALGLSAYEQSKIVVAHSSDVRHTYAQLAAHFHPGRPETIAAVTGTNGKTSTVHFLQQMWAAGGHKAVSLGTLGVRSGAVAHTDLEAVLTTYDPKSLHIMLDALAHDHGVTHAALEASSHALDQARLSGLRFEAAGFTNLTQDHLDYHGDMEAYFAAKARLFTERLAANGTAVLNLSDAYGARLAETMREKGQKVLGFRTDGQPADLVLKSVHAHPGGQRLGVEITGRAVELDIPVAGAFQGENLLCALGLALATSVEPSQALAACSNLSPVPGRLERAGLTDSGAAIYVDYAHTPAALASVLASLRPHVGSGARLHVLVGCGGDRDRDKRPKMARAAADGADRVWITDDNPRSEDPALIRQEMLAGAPDAVEVADRGQAIAAAVAELESGDLLLVAGKGHEDYQIVRQTSEDGQPIMDADGRAVLVKQPFSDRDYVRSLLSVSK